MDREDIIRTAREAGLDPDLWNYTDAFERFAALVAAAEREACAQLLDDMAARDKLSNYYAIAAKAIRERGQA